MSLQRIWIHLPKEYVRRLDAMCDMFELSRSQLIRVFLIIALDDINIQMSWNTEFMQKIKNEADRRGKRK